MSNYGHTNEIKFSMDNGKSYIWGQIQIAPVQDGEGQVLQSRNLHPFYPSGNRGLDKLSHKLVSDKVRTEPKFV